MALSRTRTNDIPEDAVLISADKALAYQWTIIKEWDKISEVWALRFTPGIIATIAGATGIFLNNHYRRKLRLGDYGKISTYLPIVALPVILSFNAHKLFVQRSILLNDPLAAGNCPLCIPVRSAAFQTGVGIAYPMVLAPLASFVFASRYFTFRLPSVTEHPMEVLKLLRKITIPIMPAVGAIFAGQSLITMYLTYKELEQNLRVQIKMEQIEHQVKEERMLN